MPKECSECGAKLKAEQKECGYCGTPFHNEDEELLIELMSVARKYNQALAKANLLEIGRVLADNYQGSLTDAGIESLTDKKGLLETVQIDKNFVSYNIHDEELIERTNDRATIRCIQTVNRRSVFEPGKFEPYIERGIISFVRLNGQWQILSQKTVTIDENGNEYE
jgi:hypothetical protein